MGKKNMKVSNFTNCYFWESLYCDIKQQRKGQLVSLEINIETTEVDITNLPLSDYNTSAIFSSNYRQTYHGNVNPLSQTPVEYLKNNPGATGILICFYHDGDRTGKATMIIGGEEKDFVNTGINYAEEIM